MARFDLYDPYTGGFRAPLAADFGTLANAADLGKVWAVGLDVNGKVVKGGGQTGIVGLMILTMEKYAGDVVDIMTDGQIADILITTPFDGFAAAAVAGTTYYGDAATGAITATAPTPAGTSGVKVGHTVERTRLIVRVDRMQA